MRLVTNRYVLLTLAAGAVLFAASRLRRLRAGDQQGTATRRVHRAVTQSTPRKHGRVAARGARVR